MRRRTIPRLAVAVLLTAGTGVATEATAAWARTGAASPAAVAHKKKPKKPTVKVATTTLGKILVAANGRTLYAFDPDGTTITASMCTDGCATVWPHLTAKGKPVAGKGLKASKLELGADRQVAYNGHLLYEFSNDKGPGQTNGQGVANVWHVVGTNGEPVR